MTVAGRFFRDLPAPFFVLATQNPSSRKEHTLCRKRSWIGSSFSSMSIIPPARRKGGSRGKQQALRQVS